MYGKKSHAAQALVHHRRRRHGRPRDPEGVAQDPTTRCCRARGEERRCLSCPRWRSSPGGSTPRCRARIESAMTPGLNALKTFDPPFSALDGAAFTGARRRGKLLLLDVDTAARRAHAARPSDERRPHPDVRQAGLAEGPHVAGALPPARRRELRVREFGTKQAAWVKLLRPDEVAADEALDGLGPEAWPSPWTTWPSGWRRRGRCTRCSATSG